MNKEQEEFILYCLSVALTRGYPRQQKEIQGYIKSEFEKLGDVE